MITRDRGLDLPVSMPPLAAVAAGAFEPPLTLLVASDALINLWRTYARSAPRVITVGDRDLSATVDAIRLKQPSQVILEQTFASSGRGAPLMTLLYGERRSRGTQIRLFTPESLRALLLSHPGDASPHTWLTSFAEPLPSRPAQRAPRVRVPSGHRILVDGRTERLVDVSSLGAQITGSAVLRPGQHVRVTPDPENPETVPGIVVWSSFEPSPVPSYRAGIAFATTVRLERFLNRAVVTPEVAGRHSGPAGVDVCGMCRGTSPASRMATFMGRKVCFDCAATCYDETE